MRKRKSLFVFLLIPLLLGFCLSGAQEIKFRPPATPVLTFDPYFSVWSFADHPADDWFRHWTGKIQAMSGMVRIDGKPYRVIGSYPPDIPKLFLKRSEITPTRTVYEFEDGGIGLTVTFLSPLLPKDINIMSRPVGYIQWLVRSVDGNGHEVSIYFDNSGELVVNSSDQEITWSRFNMEGIDILSMGTKGQPVLEKSGDDLRIDWGYLYLISPKSQNARSVINEHSKVRNGFARSGSIPGNDDLGMPRPAGDDWPVMAYQFDLGTVSDNTVEKYLAMFYDDRYSVEYFERKLQPYWKINGMTAESLIKTAVGEYSRVLSGCSDFDKELSSDLSVAGGEKYEKIAVLAFRQAIAAHKLAVDIDGTPLLFPKENFSNGCISTVDVIYPASPVLLLFNNDLAKASLTPVLTYSMMPRWKFPFAPHDLGTYPKANGQVYGGGEVTEDNQMPVEESGNMLILAYAVSRLDGSVRFISPYWPALKKWAEYLKEKGLDPENQLCTDDFAGHLAHNVNLSLKSIIALGAYSKLAYMYGDKKTSKDFWNIAKAFAKEWEKMANDSGHYRLAFDKPGTWSQKYNLVWDKVLDLNLLSDDISEKETEYYLSHQNRYGVPLDNRKDYTKADWLIWSATLAKNQPDFDSLISPLFKFLNETPDRVPFTDWYDTKTGKQVGFQARSVIGGVFMKMLSDRKMWKKWSGK